MGWKGVSQADVRECYSLLNWVLYINIPMVFAIKSSSGCEGSVLLSTSDSVVNFPNIDPIVRKLENNPLKWLASPKQPHKGTMGYGLTRGILLVDSV